METASPTERAIFAGGCFWCTEAAFSNRPGIIKVTSGYSGGQLPNPTYEQVSAKKTGHMEAIEIIYNPALIHYDQLLELFWQSIDPTDSGGQFYDRGEPYHTAIFYVNDAQKAAAQSSKEQMRAALKQEIHTKILPASAFYPAEEYHQQYHLKNPVHYNAYKHGSGREEQLKEIWRT
jgi:methionine-S-sulfoxide reductase